MSKPYAEVIGDPIAQSKSPAIHNFWLGKLGIDADYRATRVPLSQDLEDFIESRRDDPAWLGCNVTMPLKRAVMSCVYGMDHFAEAAGAVNTIYRVSDGTLTGTNTDGLGFLEPLQPLLDNNYYFRMARIIGTGGAARSIVWALSQEDFRLVLAGRDTEKARAILDELTVGEHHVAPLDHFADPTDFAFDDRDGCLDLVVNASPLGMRGQPPLAFDWSHAPPGAIAYDIVTDPVETDFLKNARAAGHRTIDGLSMLIGQAAHAFELFFGQRPPREHDAELRELLTQ